MYSVIVLNNNLNESLNFNVKFPKYPHSYYNFYIPCINEIRCNFTEIFVYIIAKFIDKKVFIEK